MNPLITFLPLIVIVLIGLLLTIPKIKKDRKLVTDDQSGFEYCSFWKRLLAFIIDFFILSIIDYFIIIIVLDLEIKDKIADFGFFFLYRHPIVLLTAFLYYTIMESSKYMATYGKMLLKMIVTDLSGKRISFGNAIARFFGKLISSFFLIYIFLMNQF